jgi:hypothetical protein
MQTPVRALKSESEHVFPGSKTAENPYGLIKLTFAPGQTSAKFTRTTDAGVIDFIRTFPGQTAEEAKHWVIDIPNKNESLMVVDPPSAVAHFYNSKLPVEQHVSPTMADARGHVWVPKTAARAAVGEFEEAIKARVNYSNLTDKNAIAMEIGLAPRKTLQANGTATSTALRIGEAFKALPAYTAMRATAAAMPDPKAHVTQAHAAILQSHGAKISGTMAIDYYHVDKNFKIAALDD